MNFLFSLGSSQLALALTIFLGTFAYEDAATLLAATLSTTGKLHPPLGLASAAAGIWAGDLLLYGAGALLGRRPERPGWLSRLAAPSRTATAAAWFERRGVAALIASRVLPGSRLPLYLVAGTVRYPIGRFAATTGVTAILWVGLIFAITHQAGPGLLMWLEGAALPGIVLLIAALLLLSRYAARGAQVAGRRLSTWYSRWSQWEFWPAWLFYPPVAAMCAWHSLRYRGFGLPTIANPSFRNGGVVGESKIEILDALRHVAPDATAEAWLIAGGAAPGRLRRLDQLCAESRLAYPLVLKPNVAQRGEGFKLARNRREAEQYLATVPADVVAQRYVPGPKEAGVFYYRLPGETTGRIFAITEKLFPTLRGDGVRTVEELIHADPRAALIAGTYLRRFAEQRSRVPDASETIRLVEAGNHCQGCVFLDGSHLNTPALTARMDEISRRLPGFFIGRYDLRYRSDEELMRGEGFQIIELNGAASEATSIYDARNSLWSAYRTLYRQWELVYAIGAENRRLGHQAASLREVWRDWRMYRRISAAYPAAD